MAFNASLPHPYPSRPVRREDVPVPDTRNRVLLGPAAPPPANPFVAMLAPLKRRPNGRDRAMESRSALAKQGVDARQ